MTSMAAQIIGEMGGPSAVAATLGRKAGAVRLWKHRGIIPRDAWPDIMMKFPGVTLEKLISVEASGPSRAVIAPEKVA